MKNIFAATAFTISAILVGVAGEATLIPAAHAEESVQTHQTLGVVESIDKEKGRVKLAHDPVPSLEWPGMTMSFAVSDTALLKSLKPGQKVKFTFVEGEGGKFLITQVTTL
jgi:Cu(I)/Ag(I) efflux system membrane fusion protein